MNFLERFKGKTSTIDKKGIDGVVMSKALPIEKDYQSYEPEYTPPKPFLKRVSSEQQQQLLSQQIKLPELLSTPILEKERSLTLNTMSSSPKKPQIKIFTLIRPNNNCTSSVRSESPLLKLPQCPSPSKHKGSFNSSTSSTTSNSAQITQLTGNPSMNSSSNSGVFSPLFKRGSRSNTYNDLMKRQLTDQELEAQQMSMLSGLVQQQQYQGQQYQQLIQQQQQHQQYLAFQQQQYSQQQQQQKEQPQSPSQQYSLSSSIKKMNNQAGSQNGSTQGSSGFGGSSSKIHQQSTESFKIKTPRLKDSPVKGGFAGRMYQLGSQSPVLIDGGQRKLNEDIRVRRQLGDQTGNNTSNGFQGQESEMLYNGGYKVPAGMSQIIVPNDYELIAVPKSLGLSHSQQFNQDGLRSVHGLPRLPLLQFQKQESTPARILGYSPLNTDSSPVNRASLGFSQVLNKQNLINSAKNILESRQKHLVPSFRYELDAMEEKHRDIIENFDKIREAKNQK